MNENNVEVSNSGEKNENNKNEFKIGDSVMVKRTSGEIEKDWEVAGFYYDEDENEQRVKVIKKGYPAGKEPTKWLLLDELKAMNK